MQDRTNVVNMHPPVLNDLARDLAEAKAIARNHSANIADIEKRILAIVGNKTEGATSVHTDHFKVTTTGKITRTLDADETKRLYLDGLIPHWIYNRLFSWVPKMDLGELRYVEQNEPDYFKSLSTALTSKPAKTAVSVTPIGCNS